MFDSKQRAAGISIVSNILLTGGKLLTGIVIGSVGIISEAIHSGIDLVASLMAFGAVRKAEQPADREHQFGHGKFENVSAFFEGLLILAAAGVIIYESAEKLICGSKFEGNGWGVLIMGISAGVNLLVSQILLKTAHKTGSPALEADALHLRTDVYTSLGVFGGMILIYFTHLSFLDPLIALLVACLIIKAAWTLIRKSWDSILDFRISEQQEKKIREIILGFAGEFVEIHELRTRQAGSGCLIDLHLVVPRRQRIYRVHELCDHLEEALQSNFTDINVLIHAEPCEKTDCTNCNFAKLHDEVKQGKCEDCSWPGCK